MDPGDRGRKTDVLRLWPGIDTDDRRSHDDPVHELLGLADHAFQSLYHFTMGMPLEDRRLTTEPGYQWERKSR